MRIEGAGHLHGEPFRLTAHGGSLLALRESDDPYPLTVDVRVGETRGRISGTLADPVRFEGLNLDVALAGPNLGRLTRIRSEEHTSDLQSLMRISYAGFC